MQKIKHNPDGSVKEIIGEPEPEPEEKLKEKIYDPVTMTAAEFRKIVLEKIGLRCK